MAFLWYIYTSYYRQSGGIPPPLKGIRMWSKFDGAVQGTMVEGDRTVPATHWWNHWWLVWRGWQTVSVFEALTDKPFRVGFRNQWGKAYLRSSPLTDRVFNALVGFEDCTFFAIDEDGREVPLTIVRRISRLVTSPLDGPSI